MNLSVKNYTKVIKDRIILDDVSLDLQSGYVYGFHGRNGSGKTMLFRAITTLIYPSSGDVMLDGVSLINSDFDLSRIGMLIENPGFYSYLSGYDNLMMLYTINHKKDESKVNEVLKKVGLFEFSNLKYKTYSLGMKKRLGIAQAIMEDQELIILDEPTNGLDSQGVLDVRQMIQEEKSKGKLILLASHLQDDLSLLCDTIYGIENGRITGEIVL